jgi:ABC-2 type transport system permease protein
MTERFFSWGNFKAVLIKEFLQMKRDRVTFGMMVAIPLIQLVIFGYAINLDPKGLPTALVSVDQGPYTRSIVAAIANTGYFDIVARPETEAEAQSLITSGDVQFVIQIPPGFTRAMLDGQQPSILVMADATEPGSAGNALAAIAELQGRALIHDLKGTLDRLKPTPPPFEFRVQRWFNPENVTQYSIVPGLTGVILTMTMMIMTALSITREHERGTMEHLLALPLKPIEVMAGKVVPYILLGYIQVAIILLAARFLFMVPIGGNFLVLALVAALFIVANLLLGFTFSTIAQNQLQAVQMSFFFFLPSVLMSGFMFPFNGMPLWARAVGEVLPLTHFIRVVRGVMLKHAGVLEIWQSIWPIAAFAVVIGGVALLRYRRTLD